MRTRWSMLTAWSALAVVLCTGTAAAQQSDSTRLAAILSGAAEAPSPGSTDGRGNASITLDPAQGQLCYSIQVSGLQNVTAAHIHKGTVGQPGPVVVPLQAPKNGTVTGCAKVDPGLIQQIAKDPSGYYVNVHDQQFPKGAIRGQLKRVM